MTTNLLPHQQLDLDKYYDITNVTDQTVLEIAGLQRALLAPSIKSAGAASVTTIIPSPSMLYLRPDWTGPETSTAVSGDIFSLADNTFDSCITPGLLHRINNLSDFLAEVYRVLKPNGILYISGEPIWSRKFGSAYNFVHLDIHYHCKNNPILLDWEHLYSSKEEIRTRLADLYSAEIIDKVLEYTFDSLRINRKFLSELVADIDNSMFTIEPSIEQERPIEEIPADIRVLINAKYPTFSDAKNIAPNATCFFVLKKVIS